MTSDRDIQKITYTRASNVLIIFPEYKRTSGENRNKKSLYIDGEQYQQCWMNNNTKIY